MKREENLYKNLVKKFIKSNRNIEKIKKMKKPELREKLIELKLIKSNSNAPLNVLRDIYLFYDTNEMNVSK